MLPYCLKRTVNSNRKCEIYLCPARQSTGRFSWTACLTGPGWRFSRFRAQKPLQKYATTESRGWDWICLLLRLPVYWSVAEEGFSHGKKQLCRGWLPTVLWGQHARSYTWKVICSLFVEMASVQVKAVLAARWKGFLRSLYHSLVLVVQKYADP